MATWYLDYEGGSDNNGGDSFAVTLTRADGVADGSTTFTSALGGFTGLSGRTIYIPSKGVGRKISSVTNDNTVILDATVTAGSGLTFNVGGRRKDLTNFTGTTCPSASSGDTVRLMGSPAPTSLSCVGNWQDCSPTIVMCGTSETLLSDCETAWTASANVTATADSTIFKIGTKSAKIDIAAGFTTGLAAYFPTGTLNLSSKQILKFWLYLSAGALPAAGQLQLKLCTDAAGVTPATGNAFDIPALTSRGNSATAMGSAYGQWHPIAIDIATFTSQPMGNAIQSVALYVVSDIGAQTIYIDDVRVCDAPNLTKSISHGESLWTAATNVTANVSSTRKQGSWSTNIAIAAGFTTGKAAYFATGTLDLSSYQQVSFWIQQGVGTLISTNQMSLRLCSDTLGVTTVNTIQIPALTGGQTSNWYCFTVDTGGNLGASIQSIALYVDSDVGAQTINIDNIFACKASSSADAISLTSLIGKSDSIGAGGADTETFYGIRSILNNTITLDTSPSANNATTSRGWSGTGQFATLYKQETTKTAIVASGATVQNFLYQGVLIEGGYDRTNMSSQTLQTWFDGQGALAFGLFINSNNNSINRVGMVRYSTGIWINTSTNGNTLVYSPGLNNCSTQGLGLNTATSFTLTNILAANNNGNSGLTLALGGPLTVGTVSMANNNGSMGINWAAVPSSSPTPSTATLISNTNNNTTYGNYLNSPNITIAEITNASKNTSDGLYVPNTSGNVTATIINACYNGAGGITIDNSDNSVITVTNANNNVAKNITLYGSGNLIYATNANNSTYGVQVQYGLNKVIGLSTTGNATSAISFFGANSTLLCNNCTFAESTKATFGGGNLYIKQKAYSFRNQQTTGAFSVFCNGGLIIRDTTVNKTTGTASWKFSPTNTFVTSAGPLEIPIVQFTAVANRTYTVQVYLRRSSSAISAQIACLKQQLQGIASEVTASNAAFVDNTTWEALSISMTPTESGPLEILARAWGGTTENCWFDDLTINDGLTTVAVSLDYQSLTGPGLEPLAGGGGGSYTFFN